MTFQPLDLSITEVSASLLKQVCEDVQQIDNLTKEVASLNEKKEELSLQVDGGVGRNIEDVRKEEEDVCQKIKVARKNLDQCQETVSAQSSLINDLDCHCWRCKGCNLLIHSVFESWEQGGSACQYNVGIQVLPNVSVT